jgi:hypothetical protein
LVFILGYANAAEVYKCTDEKGQSVYSDRPCVTETKAVAIPKTSFGGSRHSDPEVEAYYRNERAWQEDEYRYKRARQREEAAMQRQRKNEPLEDEKGKRCFRLDGHIRCQ